MFISEKVIFVELQKTACTHIGKLLSSVVSGEQVGKHNAPSGELTESGRFFLGSIRNPWDWYVSLWSYGCDHIGGLYTKVTTPVSRFQVSGHGWRQDPGCALKSLLVNIVRGRHPEVWREFYADVRNTGNFRSWLRTLLSAEFAHELGEGYSCSPISKYAGLMTYRYISLFCRHAASMRSDWPVNSIEDIKAFESEHCFVDYFVRNESLEDTFVEAMEKMGVMLSDEQKNQVYSSGRTNTSSRSMKPASYYDPETIELVGERERMIIDKFGYQPPSNPG